MECKGSELRFAVDHSLQLNSIVHTQFSRESIEAEHSLLFIIDASFEKTFQFLRNKQSTWQTDPAGPTWLMQFLLRRKVLENFTPSLPSHLLKTERALALAFWGGAGGIKLKLYHCTFCGFYSCNWNYEYMKFIHLNCGMKK